MKATIIKMIACIVVLVIGLVLALTYTDTVQIVGIVVAVLGGVAFVANAIYAAVNKNK